MHCSHIWSNCIRAINRHTHTDTLIRPSDLLCKWTIRDDRWPNKPIVMREHIKHQRNADAKLNTTAWNNNKQHMLQWLRSATSVTSTSFYSCFFFFSFFVHSICVGYFTLNVTAHIFRERIKQRVFSSTYDAFFFVYVCYSIEPVLDRVLLTRVRPIQFKLIYNSFDSVRWIKPKKKTTINLISHSIHLDIFIMSSWNNCIYALLLLISDSLQSDK